MVPSRWFWVAFLIGAFAMSCAPQIAKAEGTPGTLSPTSITGTSRFSTGLSGTLNAVLIETERRAYYSAPVSIPWGTLGAAAKAGARGVVRYAPYAGMALTAAELAGWVKEGDWFNKGDGNPGTPLPNASAYMCVFPSELAIPATYCVESTEAGAQRMAAFVMGKTGYGNDGTTTGTVTQATPTTGVGNWTVLTRVVKDGVTIRYWLLYTQSTPVEGHKPLDYRPGTPVTETEMAEKIGENPSNHYRMLHASNGEPHPFPEVVVALNGIAADIAGQTGETPVVNVTPQHPSSSSSTDPAPSGSGEGSELPAFCEWARVVCEFIEWYKDEGEPLEEQPVPWDESEIQMQEWSSGQSGGSCPAPVSTSAMGEQVEFSYQPICDFAESMYGVMIAMALAVAAFIIAGLRSGKV